MKMAKNRLTRNSFKRKIIVFGVAIFMSVAMMATGFAAWVISSNAKVDGQIGVQVTTIEEASIKVTLDSTLFPDKVGEVYTHKNNFVFGTDANDTKGKVKGSVDDVLAENLTIRIAGKVEGIEQLGKLTLVIDFGEVLRGVADAEYITLPATEICFFDVTNPEAKTEGAIFTDNSDDTADFSFNITLGWGKKFAYVNPGYYYDCVKDSANTPLTDEDVAGSRNNSLAEIQALKSGDIMSQIREFRTVFGLDNDTTKDVASGNKIVKVTVNAEVK